jgi:hypothetical protein
MPIIGNDVHFRIKQTVYIIRSVFSLLYYMKYFVLIFGFVLAIAQGQCQVVHSRVPPPVIDAQRVSKPDLARLAKMEDTLRQLLNIVMYDTTVKVEENTVDYTGAIIRNMALGKVDTTIYLKPAAKNDTIGLAAIFERRKKACYKFIPKLIAALKISNSFYYPFDSLAELSKVYPPDSSFRILTWQMHYPRGRFRYYGVIQMRSGRLKMFPLRDLRDTLPFHTQQLLTENNWYGQIYYKIVEKMVNKKAYYTLFGFEAPDFVTRRKIIDILTFDEAGKPHFGAPIFDFKYDDSSHYRAIDTMSRFFIEYKWSATPTLNYDYNKDMIVFDHLAPPDPRANGVYFMYVEDGTYEGFKWQGNHWQWVEKVFNFAINEDDNPPIPSPLYGTPKKQPKLPDEIEH